MKRSAPPVDARPRAGLLGCAAACVVLGVGLCWVLAHPAGPAASAWPGALSLAAACLLLGLGGLERLDAHARPATIAVTAGVWGAASLIAAWLQLADRAGRSPLSLSVDDISLGLDSGLPLLICVAGSVVLLGWAYRPYGPSSLVAVVAVAGVLVTSTTGHASASSWEPLVIGLHALCAAWWAGTLAAMVLSVRGRRGWAQTLPQFSRYAAVAVGVLTASGMVAGVARLGLNAELWTAGYGRVLIAKTVLLVVAVGVAAWHRRTWLERVRRHQVTESESIRRAGLETALLAVVVGLAAGLSTTA